MVAYHYTFLILQYFKVYPNLKGVASINPNLIGAVEIYPNIYNICKSERTSSTLPDLSNSTQVLMQLFQLPNFD